MSFSKIYYFALLCTVMLLPACAKKANTFQEQYVGEADTCIFGQYPQATETPEPIEWIVLDIDSSNDKMLLLSKYVLDSKPYDTNRTTTWDKSSLRNWLNHEFLNAVFSSSEQASILTTHVENPDTFGGPKGGDDTDDKIFLLSPNEAKRYFRDDAARVAKATTYAIHNSPLVSRVRPSGGDFFVCDSDVNLQCSTIWWLRAPGTSTMMEGSVPFRAARVTENGYLFRSGDNVRNEVGVRPALWVNAQACAKNSESTAAAPATPAAVPPAPAPAVPLAADNCDGPGFMGQCVVKGNTVTFGQYPQATETPDPIEWIVLDIDSSNGKMLLLSKYVINAQSYRENPSPDDHRCAVTPITWEISSPRRWLNDVFLKEAFSSSEQAAIPSTLLENPSNPYGTNGGNATNDKVFLLSIEEANRYFQSDADRKARATPSAIRNRVWVNADNGYRGQEMTDRCANSQCEAVWWLRSPGYEATSAAHVRTGGDVDIYGTNVCSSHQRADKVLGIRPALWVNYAVSPDAAEPSAITPPPPPIIKDGVPAKPIRIVP